MILNLVGVDKSLEQRLKEHFEHVNSVDSVEDIEVSERKTSIIISDKVIGYEEISKEDFNDHEYVFYLLSNDYTAKREKNIQNICNSNEINLLPSRLVEEQILERILEVINPYEIKEKNIISFLSVGQNVGVTSLTVNVAKSLSIHTKSKVGVLLLNAWDSGEGFLPQFKGKHLNEIKGKLSNRLLDNEDEFLSVFHQYDNMYVLGGNKSVRLERLYTKDEIHYLIQKAQEYFDVVLIDSGSHFDNANMIQSLEESQFRYVVVNQQPKLINKWNNLKQSLFQPLGYTDDDFMLLINQYKEKGMLRTATEITKEYNSMMLTTIPYSKYGTASENDDKFLYDYEDVGFNEAIDHIMKAIARETDLEFKQFEKKKKSIFSFS